MKIVASAENLWSQPRPSGIFFVWGFEQVRQLEAIRWLRVLVAFRVWADGSPLGFRSWDREERQKSWIAMARCKEVLVTASWRKFRSPPSTIGDRDRVVGKVSFVRFERIVSASHSRSR
jgi:hypothetical protein